MQHPTEHNQNANFNADDSCLPPQAVPPQLDGPPSPLDVVCERDGDEADWVSYPAFYPHVVQLQTEEDQPAYGMRMRGSDGQLKLLYGPEQDLEEVRRQVELRWLYFLDACLRTPDYGEEDAAEMLHRYLYALEKNACSEPPPGARAPFQAVNLEEIDQADLYRYPVGYPFVVLTTDDREHYATTAMIRTEDLNFKTFRALISMIGDGEGVVKWNLTLETPGIEHADRRSVEAVTEFHVSHCRKRGVKPATCPKVEEPVGPYW